MNASTVAALNRINRLFYSRYHESFSATRSRPWPGWQRAIAPFLAQSSGDPGSNAARTILDVGCGNGRFAVFLDSAPGGPYRYLGVDDSVEMIGRARQRLERLNTIEAHFQRRDLALEEGGLDLDGRPFDLVVLFGILHHLPALHRRRRLLNELAGGLAPAGFMILSFWQFGKGQRFQRRILDWSDHNRMSGDRVDERQLESGDFLLAWGSSHETALEGEDCLGARRYCHYADAREAVELTSSLGLDTVDRFESDGRSGNLNLYFVLRAPG